MLKKIINSFNAIKKETLKKSPFFISYFITDPIEFGDTAEKFSSSLTKTFQNHTVDMVCFRDKTSQNKEELAAICIKIAQKFGIEKVLINSDIDLAQKLQFDGVHLNSTQFKLLSSAKKLGLYTLISCHTKQEIEQAYTLGADAVTYSPIFFKENKGSPKGLLNLSTIVKQYQKKDFHIIALGGITDDDKIIQIQKTAAKGFASIRYFQV